MFYTHRDVEVLINNKKIIANSMEISQSVDISHPIFQGESVSSRNVVNSPIIGNLKLKYYLTGLDPLKDYLYSNQDYPLNGNICGMKFNNGYLGSYSLSAEPNAPISIDVDIPFFDELTGIFSPVVSSGIADTQTLNFNDSYFNYNSNYSVNSLSNNSINSYQWNYKAEIKPIYYYAQNNVNNLVPDRVSINQKDISAQITCDSSAIPLSFMGENFAIELKCPHPTNPNIYESYACSGLINQRNFSLESNSLSKTTFGISQSHLNSTPLIGSVITYTYPSLGNTIQVLSTNVNPNGFLSNNENINLIERVKIGDTYVPFTITDGPIYDTLNATITNETTNGYLTLETMKGVVQYPVPLDLSFANPSISSFSPITGQPHAPITINGLNFYRITDVLFNGKSSNFNLIQNTGATHQIVAYVPEDANIGKISVVSTLRDASGVSTQIFYPQIRVNGFSPTSGVWGMTVNITGKNFSGINSVYFGPTAASSFNVINNNLLTAVTPYNGFSKGKISITSTFGLSGASKNLYRPLFPITGISVISGTASEDMNIGVWHADVSYLYPQNGGYKIAFGDKISTFYVRNGGNFTGLIPPGFIGNSYISFYEPDGVTKYPGFTGKFYGIGPAPIIGYNTSQNGQLNPDISPNTFPLLSTNSITIGGSNMKDFFGLSEYLVISGYGNEFKFSDIKVSSLNNRVTIDNVRITGNPDTNTGYYTVYLKNIVGSSNFVNSGVLITSPKRYIPEGAYLSRSGKMSEGNYISAQYLFDNEMGGFNSTATYVPSYWVPGIIPPNPTVLTGDCHIALYFYDVSTSPSNLNALSIVYSNREENLTEGYIYQDVRDNTIRNFSVYSRAIHNLSLKILTGNNFVEAVYQTIPYQNYPASQNVAYSENFSISSGNNYYKIFDPPIKNFKGIKIWNNEEVLYYVNDISHVGMTHSAAIAISEIKIY